MATVSKKPFFVTEALPPPPPIWTPGRPDGVERTGQYTSLTAADPPTTKPKQSVAVQTTAAVAVSFDLIWS
jgi:hypothetical protein